MSYLFSSSSYPKVRQEGFHTQQQQQPSVGHAQAGLGSQSQSQAQQQSIPTPNAFDPNSIYTTGALFAEAYRATTADPFARRYEQQQQQQQATQSQQSQPGTSLDIHDELSFLNPPNSATSGMSCLSLALWVLNAYSDRIIPTTTTSSRHFRSQSAALSIPFTAPFTALVLPGRLPFHHSCIPAQLLRTTRLLPKRPTELLFQQP